MRTSRIASLAMMAAVGGMGFAASGVNSLQTVITASNPSAQNNQPVRLAAGEDVNQLMALFNSGFGRASRQQRRRAGYGWTNAHAKRVARKARNVKRFRASNR